MKLTNFIEKGEFYKSNFHTHSTNSDGSLSPDEAIKIYRDNGYS